MNVASLLSAEEERPEEALAHYRHALALRTWPEMTAAHAEYNAALALQALGRVSSALTTVRRSLALAPGFEPALELLAELEGDGAGSNVEAGLEEDSADDGLETEVQRASSGSSEQAVNGISSAVHRATSDAGDADGGDGCASAAEPLLSAAATLRKLTRRALSDPGWLSAAHGSEERRGTASELAAVISDVGALLNKLLADRDNSEAAHENDDE